MPSPEDFLQRREREVDEALGRCLQRMAMDHEPAELVRKHPLAALGGGAAAGFLATRVLLNGSGGGLRSLLLLVRPLRSLAYGASMLAMAADRPEQAEP